MVYAFGLISTLFLIELFACTFIGTTFFLERLFCVFKFIIMMDTSPHLKQFCFSCTFDFIALSLIDDIV